MKKKNIIKHTFIILSLFVFSCMHRENEKVQENHEVIDFSLEHLDKLHWDEFITAYTIIPLETTEKSFISRIERVIFRNNKLYILNTDGLRSNILVFTKEGKYLRKIDKQGRGNGEYLFISDFDLYPDSNVVTILDPLKRTLLNYDIITTQYQNSFHFEFWAKEFKYIKDIKEKVAIVLATEMSRNNGKDYDIYVIDADRNNILRSAFPFDKPIGIMFGNGILMQSFGNYVNYLRPNTNLIYSIDYDSIYLRYKILFPGKVLPSEKTEEFFRKKLESDEKYVYNIIYFENRDYLYTRFRYDKKSYHGFFNKKTKESYLFGSIKDMTCNCGITLDMCGTLPHHFIVKTDFLKVGNVVKFFDPNNKKCQNPEIWNEVHKLDETSNPLLILLTVENTENGRYNGF